MLQHLAKLHVVRRVGRLIAFEDDGLRTPCSPLPAPCSKKQPTVRTGAVVRGDDTTPAGETLRSSDIKTGSGHERSSPPWSGSPIAVIACNGRRTAVSGNARSGRSSDQANSLDGGLRCLNMGFDAALANSLRFANGFVNAFKRFDKFDASRQQG